MSLKNEWAKIHEEVKKYRSSKDAVELKGDVMEASITAISENKDEDLDFSEEETESLERDISILLLNLPSFQSQYQEVVKKLGKRILPIDNFIHVVKVGEQSSMTISQMIDDYNLNQEQRFEVARKVARSDAKAISWHIQNYKLSKEQRYMVALLAVKNDPLIVSKHMENFKLSQNQRFNVAKSVAKQDVVAFDDYVTFFKLTPEQCAEMK
ncbi:MAG: hypothetical protein ACI9S8_002770 [Chlamydiales bacterium]|jgi:hypothetical protein